MGRDKKKKYDSTSDDSDNSGTESSASESVSTDDTTSNEQQTRKRKKSLKDHHRRKSSQKSKKSKHNRKNKKHVEVISDDDYFKKSSEFRSWLSNERGIYFSDLSSAKSRKLFSKFVRKWNSSQLKKVYYKGIQSSSLEYSTQTDYKWKLTDHDEIRTGSVKDQVSSWTSGGGFEEDNRDDRREKGVGSVMRGPEKPRYLKDPHQIEEEKEEKQKLLRKSRKEFRKHHEMVIDELVPKATGREAKIEKRKFMNQQRREREISPDIDDSSLMGASDKFKDKIKSKQEDREKRAQIASQKISDYRDKEKSKVAAILEMAKANKKEGSLW